MKAVLLRTSSFPVLTTYVSDSPRVLPSVRDFFTGILPGKNGIAASPRISLHLEVNRRPSLRRVFSESDVIRSENDISGGLTRLSGVRSQCLPARIPEEECVSDSDDVVAGGIGSLMLTGSSFDRRHYAGDWPGSGISVEQLGFPGGGIGKGRLSGGGSSGDGFGDSGFTRRNDDRSKIRAYYGEMLKSNPMNSLLLSNYGKFLHEVERDTVKAEEYYGRAILASPGNGEVLSLYGKLIWETQRDEDRAKSYFNQAVQASPDDCMVLGSYAHFMWETEDDKEEEEREREIVSTAMVEAF